MSVTASVCWGGDLCLHMYVFGNGENLLLHAHGNSDCVYNDHRLVGLVVKASASRAEDPGFEYRLRRDFIGVESYQ